MFTHLLACVLSIIGVTLAGIQVSAADSVKNADGGIDMNLIYQVLPSLLGDRSQLPIVLLGLLTESRNDSCSEDVRHIIDGIGKMEMWALEMFDATGKPQRNILQGSTVWFGSYDDCLKVHHTIPSPGPGYHSKEINGIYAMVTFALSPNLTAGLGAMSGFAANIRWDICVPNSCTVDEITRFANSTQFFSLGLHMRNVKFSETKSIDGDVGAYITISVLSVFALLCFVGTIYDIIQQSSIIEIKSKPERKNNDILLTNIISSGEKILITPSEVVDAGETCDKHGIDNPSLSSVSMIDIATTDGVTKNNINNNNITSVTKSTSNKNDRSLLGKLLLSFSVLSNGKKILNCSSPSGTIACLHGIRVLSMAWVILGHFILQMLSEVENKKDLIDMTKTYWFQCIIAGILSVDTFFLLSGLLVAYLFLREVSKIGKITWKQMGLFYFHRYWRLTPLYMVVILIFTNLTSYMMVGPITDNGSTQFCVDNWWTNLLYINNLYKASESEMCMGWSWYMANDMQFYVISPLALIPLALGFRVIGMLVISSMLAIHIIASGYLGWNIGSPGKIGLGGGLGISQYFEDMYVKPYTRVGVYAIGLFLGYIIHTTKGHKKISKLVLILGSFIAISIGILTCYITYDNYRFGGNSWTSDSYITHDTLFRPAWALCVSWLIFVCVHGYGGFINDVLSWGAWIPLSRLTYAAYMIHLIVLSISLGNMRSLGYMNAFYIMDGFIGIFAISYAASFILVMLVESPCLGIEKVFLKK